MRIFGHVELRIKHPFTLKLCPDKVNVVAFAFSVLKYLKSCKGYRRNGCGNSSTDKDTKNALPDESLLHKRSSCGRGDSMQISGIGDRIIYPNKN